MRFTTNTLFLSLALTLALAAAPPHARLHAQAAAADPTITSPLQQFGHELGADYLLVDFQDLAAYWARLAAESDRMVLDTIGRTAEGRPHLMAIVTSPDNHHELSRHKEIARRLALAEGVDEAQARRLSGSGRAVVWIDGGLHATEVLGAQQLMETVYRMVAGTDAETLRILDDVIILFVHANPDGHDLVADWYMRHDDPHQRSTSQLPVLYQKYAGHDNNRDFYMAALAETENMNRVAYREWFPQIVYNHHQTGPEGTVMFAPPFRGPANYHLDGMILLGIDLVGAEMHGRFLRERKPGTTMRSGASYSTWWNGGLRTTPYYHNMIGLLTETIGHPTPMRIPFVPDRHLQTNDMPFPIEPQPWHFRQSVEYSVTANMAVLDLASRMRETFLYNIWRMGMNSIERGGRDHWTIYPRPLDSVRAEIGSRTGTEEEFHALLRDPADRDARAYVIPREQRDFPTAVKFANALVRAGVQVHRAPAAFTLDGQRYGAGTLVVRADQAFRPHVLDMFEPQDHPDDIPYPGAAPIAPYDNAGWTLAFQMGVAFDRILDGLPPDLALEALPDVADPPPGRISGAAGGPAGFLLAPGPNDVFTAANRLLAGGHSVHWLLGANATGAREHPERGALYVAPGPGVAEAVAGLAGELGLDARGLERRPSGDALRLRPLRIGLVDVYGGSMPSGWTRLIFEDFDFPYRVVYPAELDAGGLIDRYDALVFVPGLIPEADRPPRSAGPAPADVPEEYRHMLGTITVEHTVPRILEFARAGGSVVASGGSSVLGRHAGLPLGDHLMVMDDDGSERALRQEEYFVPGSILRTRVDNAHPLAHGLDPHVDVMFRRSPVFRLEAGAEEAGVRRVGWYDSPRPLRSGWAWGQEHLEGGASIVEADVGAGKLFLFGPEVLFRAQSHEAFRLLFNALHYGASEREAL